MNETIFCSPTSHKIYSKVETPYSYIYAVFFLLIGLVATAWNFVSIQILKLPGFYCKKKFVILMSMALSDFIVGSVLCPFMVYQMISTKTLNDCNFFLARGFLVYGVVGPSAITILIIAYDRYVAVTKLWEYDKHMSRRKIYTLLFLAWAFPCGVMSIDVASQSLKLMNFYKISRILTMAVVSGVLIGLIAAYILIVITVRREDRRKLSSFYDDKKAGKKIHSSPKRRYLRTANNTSLLVLCYVLCFLPSVIAIGISIIARLTENRRILDDTSYHHFSLFTLVAAILNSCVNPAIYTSRYPEFRKHIKRKWQRLTENPNIRIRRNGSLKRTAVFYVN